MKKKLTIFGFFVYFLYIFISFFHPIILDFDLGRHLLFGKIMTQSHQFININLISYTNPDYAYVNSHWLSEVLFFLIFKFFNFYGLICFAILISLLTFYLLFIFVAKRYDIQSILLSFLFCVALLSTRAIDLRPELFSYLLLIIFIIILFKYKEISTNSIFLLIPLEAIWVNLHINFIIGPILIILFLVDQVVVSKFRPTRQVLILFIVFISSITSALFNPNFVKGLLYPLNFYKNYSITPVENLNIFLTARDFGIIHILLIILIILALFTLFLFYRKRVNLIDWLLILVFSASVIIAVRNVALFAYGIFIPLVKILTFFLADISLFLSKRLSNKHMYIFKIYCLLFICFTLFLLSLKQVSSLGFGFGVVESHKLAVDFYLKNSIKGPIYNNINLGQYLAYRLYPNERIFMDMRPEAYPSTFFLKTYYPLLSNPKLFNKISQDFNINVVILSHSEFPANILRYFIYDSGFKLIYLDGTELILLKNNEQNKNLIDKYLINKQNYVVRRSENTNTLVGLFSFFKKLEWKNQEHKTYSYLNTVSKTKLLFESIELRL